VTRQDIIEIAAFFVESSQANYISKEIAISENVIGMRIFDAPILAFGDANDEYFKVLKDPLAVGEHFILPKEWLPQTKTVISFFLPFNEVVRKGNSREGVWPSEEWLHGRIEGQILVNKLSKHLKSELIKEGFNSLAPSLDKRFWSKAESSNSSSHPEPSFTSNWSERHVAFVCGLGTFGLSKGLITEKGMSGRFGSIITELYIAPDKRKYEGIYEYCSMCEACVKNCPVNAITIKDGKDHFKCSRFIDKTLGKFKPRYGCGKCQVNVPCEFEIPQK